MGHIFISYSHKDSSYVHRLAEALKQEGFEVWIDDNIQYGSEWPRVVTRNLDASDGVIVVLSNNSLESDMVQNEVTRAREKKKPIFPLLLDGDNWLIVQAKQFVDVRDSSLPTEKFYRRLEEITPRKMGEHEAKQKAEREATEKAMRENSEHDASKKAKREKTKRQVAQGDAIKKFFPKAVPFLRIVDVVGIIFILFWMGSRAMPQFASLLPIAKSTTTNTKESKVFTPVAASQTKTPTLTFTPTSDSLVIPFSVTSTLVVPVQISPIDGMVLHYVPAGIFTMGDTAEHASAECQKTGPPPDGCKLDRFTDEEPVHRVYLDAFWMDETEVTNGKYKLCVKAGACQKPSTISPYYSDDLHGDYPVVFVVWNDANSYCQWAERRLPTEAEWEKAARGTDERTYPWGEAVGIEYANYNTSRGDVTKVHGYELGKSPYGLYDMAGNVYEFVSDWYHPDYYKTLGEIAENPRGPTSGQGHVAKGGGFLYNSIRPADREARDRATNEDGFRCAKDATP